jgi:hypothetical protein
VVQPDKAALLARLARIEGQVRGVARSAPLQYLMPPIAALVSWWWLGETFTWIKIGGALIVMAGVAYAQFAGRRVEAAEEQVDAA